MYSADIIDPEVARSRIDRLNPREQDILALLTLGFTIGETANRLSYSVPGIKPSLSNTIYPVIEARSSFKRAREVAWAAGLLEQAWAANVVQAAFTVDMSNKLPVTRTTIQEYRLGVEYIWVMNNYHLTLKELEIMRLIAQGVKTRDIAELKGKNTKAIKDERYKIGTRLGTKNKQKLLAVLSDLGKAAVEPRPFFW